MQLRWGRWALLLIASVMFPALVNASTDWPNEPTGATVLNDWGHNLITGGGWYDIYGEGGTSSIASDATGPLSPSNVLQQLIPAGGIGGNTGGGGNLLVLASNYSDIYWGNWFKVDANFENHPAGTKIGWIHTRNGTTPQTNNLFLLLTGGSPFQIQATYQNSTIDNSHLGYPVGTVNLGPSGGIFNANVWVRVETYFRASTCTTCRDGVWKVWLTIGAGGSPVQTINVTNLNTDPLRPDAVSHITVWGGGPVVKSRDSWMWWDHEHVSFPNCSLAGCEGGDSTPPSQVTGLGVSINGTTATLTWSAASDNVGVTGYLVEKCTPHGCSNWALAQTVGSLSASVGSLTPGTSYDFRVRATDAAGNLGSYSATVTGTTSSEVERTLATDDFNRANGALGANWTGSYSGSPNLTIVSNAVRGTATTGDNLMTYTAISSPADQWAKVDVTTATGAGLYAGGVVLRTAASPLASYYMCRMQTNGWAGTMIERLVNGSYTLLASSTPATWAVGDTLKCTARSSTITLSRIRSGVETVMLTATDSTHATGKTGVITYADTVANFGFDNFSTGDWTVAAAAPTITSFTSDATGANVTWAGSPAYIRVQTYTTTGIYDDVVEPIASFPGGRYSRVWPLGINSGCVFAQDASHVENTNPSDYQCGPITPAPPADTTPPTLSSLLPSGTLPQGTTSTTISVITNETATCKYSDTDQAYASMPSTFSTANGTSHSATKSSLTNGSSYTVYVRCLDAAGNANTSSGTIAFSVASAPAADTTPPSTVTGLSAVALSTSQIQAAWTDATDNVAVASYRLYACVGTGCSDYALVASPVGTSATIAGLIASTVYRLVVDAIDTSGNISAAHSSAYEVTTSANVDIVPPSTLMNLRQSGEPTYNTAGLTWDAGTDNVGISQALIERCAGVACEDFQTIRSVSGTTLSDSTVQFGTTYRYRGKHRDTSGNVSTNYSSILSVVVPAPPVGVTAGVCPCKTH